MVEFALLMSVNALWPNVATRRPFTRSLIENQSQLITAIGGGEQHVLLCADVLLGQCLSFSLMMTYEYESCAMTLFSSCTQAELQPDKLTRRYLFCELGKERAPLGSFNPATFPQPFLGLNPVR